MTDDDVLARLEEQLGDIEVSPTVEVVTAIPDAQLLSRFAAVERELRERSEMMQPRTDTGRDLHSARAAYLIELKRRKMR